MNARHEFRADTGESPVWATVCCTRPKNHRVHAVGRELTPVERLAEDVERALATTTEEADRLASALSLLARRGIVRLLVVPEAGRPEAAPPEPAAAGGSKPAGRP